MSFVRNGCYVMDDLERTLMLGTAAFSLLITTLGLIVYGFLKQVGVEQPTAPYIIIFVIFIWLVGKLGGSRKYKSKISCASCGPNVTGRRLNWYSLGRLAPDDQRHREQ